MQPVLGEVATTNSFREFLQVFQYLLHTPATADIVTDYTVKHVTTISSGRSTSPHDLLDFVDAVFATVAVQAVSGRCDLCRCFRSCRPAAFSPDDGPVDHAVDVGELTACVEGIAGDGHRFVCAAKQLNSDFFAVDHQREFPLQAMTAVCQAPNAATATGRSYFRITMPSRIEEILRPCVDRMGVSVAAMI